MATDRWNDDRLDRLADMVEANRLQIEANSQDIASLKESIAETNRNVNQLVGVMRQQQEANTEIFQAIVQEIRGLRAENRRILTHLFGEQAE